VARRCMSRLERRHGARPTNGADVRGTDLPRACLDERWDGWRHVVPSTRVSDHSAGVTTVWISEKLERKAETA
jgi:hypothetical protein